VLTLNSDYTVNVQATKPTYDSEGVAQDGGTITFEIVGANNFTGTYTYTVELPAQTSLDGAKLGTAAFAAATYAGGEEVKPALNAGTIILSDGVAYKTVGTDFTLDKDFTIEYTNNREAGTATATIKGINNYTGSFTTTFTIGAKSIASATNGDEDTADSVIVDVDFDALQKAGSETARKAAVSAKYVVKAKTSTTEAVLKDLVYGTDFETKSISTTNKSNGAVEATVVITGKKNLSGDTSSMTISLASVADEDIALKYDGTTYSTYSDGDLTVGYKNEAIQPEVIIGDGETYVEGTDYDVTYGTNKDAGTGTVTITGKSNKLAGSKTLKFTINEVAITSAMIDFDRAVYDTAVAAGTSYNAAIVVKNGTVLLTENTDYKLTVTKIAAVGTEPEKIQYTVEGINNYKNIVSGTKSLGTRTKLDGYSVTVKDEYKDKLVYSGDALDLKSAILVKAKSTDADDTAVDAKNYDITVEPNAVDAGKVTITVTGKGDYEGSTSGEVTIEAKSISGATVTIDEDKIEAAGTDTAKLAAAVTVKDGDKDIAASDYTVIVARTVENGKVKVTATVTGQNNYKDVVTKDITYDAKTDISDLDITVAGATYTGKALTPAVTVKDGETVLAAEDVSVEYVNNVDAGTAQAIVTVTGKYTGTKTVDFTIAAASISDATVTVDGTGITYSGSAKKPAVSVKVNGVVLEKGTDYTVSYKNNKNAGKATVTVTGTNNYTGSASKTFTIAAKSLSSAKAKVTGVSTKTYANKAVTQSVTVKVGDTTLKKGTDYTVSYKNNNKPGKATVTITGKGNYKGSISTTFTIKPAKTTVKSVKSSKAKKATITWSKVTGADGYEVYQATSKSGTYSKVKTVTKGSTVSYTKGSLKSGKTYYYKVRAYKTIDGKKVYGSYSAVKSVKVK
jgi:hypothetical protein